MKKLILKTADDKRVYFFLVAYRGPHGTLAVFATFFMCYPLKIKIIIIIIYYYYENITQRAKSYQTFLDIQFYIKTRGPLGPGSLT